MLGRSTVKEVCTLAIDKMRQTPFLDIFHLTEHKALLLDHSHLSIDLGLTANISCQKTVNKQILRDLYS
jgi:hypothetical protein